MRVNNFNREVNLLNIVNKDKVNSKTTSPSTGQTSENNFSTELARAGQVNLSRHAQERLFSRGIELSETKLAQLSQAIDKAALKGSKDTLILDESAAYVVSVPNRTVITAFGRENLREGVFTSIDSAVIL